MTDGGTLRGSERVKFEGSRGRKIAGAVHMPMGWREGGPAVVVCHGLLSSKDSPKHVETARRMAEAGLAALRFDFGGRGESEGSFEELTVGGQVRDLEGAVRWIRARGAGSVCLVGSSLGGAVAVLVAGGLQRAGEIGKGFAALAVMACVSRPGSIFERRLGPEGMRLWRESGRLEVGEGLELGWGFQIDAATHDVLGASSRVRCPALFVHGSEDEMVPWQASVELAAAARAGMTKASGGEGTGEERVELVIVQGADHRFSDPGHQDQAIGMVERWCEGCGHGAPGE